MSIFRHGWYDREADVTDQRIDNHFTRLLDAMPGTTDGPKPGDHIYHQTGNGTEPPRTWIGDDKGLWEATDIVDKVEPTEGGFTVTGRKRGNGITKPYDLWTAHADTLESSDGLLQGRVK